MTLERQTENELAKELGFLEHEDPNFFYGEMFTLERIWCALVAERMKFNALTAPPVLTPDYNPTTATDDNLDKIGALVGVKREVRSCNRHADCDAAEYSMTICDVGFETVERSGEDHGWTA